MTSQCPVCFGVGTHTESCAGQLLAPPADATEVLDWSQHGPGLLRRPFLGTMREAAGFRVRVEGIQRENGTSLRRVLVDAPGLTTQLQPEAVRQLASALTAAAGEIEARR